MQTSEARTIATTLVEHVGRIRSQRMLAKPQAQGPWENVLEAADANRPTLEKHFSAAFKKAKASMGLAPTDQKTAAMRMDLVLQQFEKDLLAGLPEKLHDTLVDGADAAAHNLMGSPQMVTAQGFYKPTLVLLLRALGDKKGHEFHGNQYRRIDTEAFFGGGPKPSQEGVVRLQKPGGKVVTINTKEMTQEQKDKILGKKADPIKIADEMSQGLPGDTRNIWTDETDPDTGFPQVQIYSMTKDGKTYFQRSFSRDPDGSLGVHHEMFEVDTKLQGKGTAKQVLRDSMSAYQKLGVAHVDMLANLDVGGYAWAKFGFVAREPEVLAEQLSDKMGKSWKLSLASKKKLENIITDHFADPKLPWYIAGAKDSHGKPIGKELLLNSEWHATLSLKDKAAMKRFNHYVAA